MSGKSTQKYTFILILLVFLIKDLTFVFQFLEGTLNAALCIA